MSHSIGLGEKKLAGDKRPSLFCSGVSGEEENSFVMLTPSLTVEETLRYTRTRPRRNRIQ